MDRARTGKNAAIRIFGTAREKSAPRAAAYRGRHCAEDRCHDATFYGAEGKWHRKVVSGDLGDVSGHERKTEDHLRVALSGHDKTRTGASRRNSA